MNCRNLCRRRMTTTASPQTRKRIRKSHKPSEHSTRKHGFFSSSPSLWIIFLLIQFYRSPTTLLQTKRYDDDGIVLSMFAQANRTFVPVEERITARDRECQRRADQLADKGGISIAEEPVLNPPGPVLPINHNVSVVFGIRNNNKGESLSLDQI